MALFRADLTDASLARVEDDYMVIDIWHDGAAARGRCGGSSGNRVPPGGVGYGASGDGSPMVAFTLRRLPGAGAGRWSSRSSPVYKYGRFLAPGHVETAVHNARDVIDLERALGVFSEARLQDLVLHDTTLVRFLNVYYLVAHVAVTAAAFVWLYARHPQGYRRFRNVMVVITLTGMVVHLAAPAGAAPHVPAISVSSTPPGCSGPRRTARAARTRGSPTSSRPCRRCTSGGRW